MKRKNILMFSMLFACTLFCSSTAFAEEKVMPQDIYYELVNNDGIALYSSENNLLSTVTLSPSLSIEIPKIDTSKVHVAIPIGNYDSDLVMKQELRNHGYTDQEIEEMDIGDYQEISATWYMSEERIDTAKEIYPELAEEDLSLWTNGQYDNYIKEKNQAFFYPTESQIDAFEERNITIDDATILTKKYGTFEDVLAQSDQDLKEDLEQYYQFVIDNIVSQAEIQMGTRAVDTDLYIQVPSFAGYQYNNDWFLKSVSTHVDYWRGIQESRVLKAFKALYNTNTVPSVFTWNLYGTFSQRQQGAHEGIDFGYGQVGTSIYNIMLGTVRSPEPDHSWHHLCVYDSTYDKSYTYLYMNEKSVSENTVLSTIGIKVGEQGEEGNADGAHVHFEVHSGNTYALAPETDDILQSISPYQLQVYLGE